MNHPTNTLSAGLGSPPTPHRAEAPPERTLSSARSPGTEGHHFLPIDVALAVKLVAAARWAAKVAVGSGGCKLWTGAKDSDGYGQVWLAGRATQVHRVAWVAANARDVSDGLTVDHLCRVHGCVNPAHLEPVTNRKNVLRGDGPSAKNARMTHCATGLHRLGDGNAYPGEVKIGRRPCRECHRARARERRVSGRASRAA